MSDTTIDQRRSPVLLEGFLWKKGAKGLTLGLKRRWFSLSNNKLYYFKSPEAFPGSELGYIDLRGEFDIEQCTESDNTCYFRIRTPNRIWHLTAEAEDERKFWIDGLTRFKNNNLKDSGSHQDSLDTFLQSTHRNSSDEFSEVQSLLLSAEREISTNQARIDELNSDLENSIRIIKLKGEQIDLLNQRLDKKEQENQDLRNENRQLLSMLAEKRDLNEPVSEQNPFDGTLLAENPLKLFEEPPAIEPSVPVLIRTPTPPLAQVIPVRQDDIASMVGSVSPPDRELFLTSKLQETAAKLRVKTTLLEMADRDSRILSDFLQFLQDRKSVV